MWQKEKLLVTSNFSVSHSVFKRFILKTRKNQGLFGKGLSLNIVLHQLRSKFLQFVQSSLDSASWELHQYPRRMCGPMKIPKLTRISGNRTRDLVFARPTLFLKITDTKKKKKNNNNNNNNKMLLINYRIN